MHVKKLPLFGNYATQRDADSMINTPPTFAWYLCSLVFKHLKEIGGLEIIEKRNALKAQLFMIILIRANFIAMW
ncbi:3-phosphoserine/phosphohydroxythreonine aminotransferase [Haemophilus influenzae]|uniref:Phosphoserine aminotransferase n=1 Tax=Haemophilus influenzae TaxID=727 RepID=A0A2X1RUE4_HAEIF|nr:3-phosphoserine/phosphohydroxythreonine aminotransferase [Haemophilus influenzae]